MIFTYRNNVWKGQATNSIVPSNSKPITKYDNNYVDLIAHQYGKPNPIKHWRKQLKPTFKTQSSKQVSFNNLESANYIGDTTIDCDNNYKLLKENITPDLTTCNGVSYLEPFYGPDVKISDVYTFYDNVTNSDGTTTSTIKDTIFEGYINGSWNLLKLTNAENTFLVESAVYVILPVDNTISETFTALAEITAASYDNTDAIYKYTVELNGDYDYSEYTSSTTFTDIEGIYISLVNESDEREYRFDVEYLDTSLGTETDKPESELRSNQNYGIKKCTGGTNKIRRSGSTIVKKGYCASSSQYLKSRCKTYEQNQKRGAVYNSTKNLYKGTTCPDNYCKYVVSKHSNPTHHQQGSVSASAQILKKKYEARTKHGVTMKTAYGVAPLAKKPYYENTTDYEYRIYKTNPNKDECEFKNC